MRRVVTVALVVIGLCLAMTTWSQEQSSRYHLDSLRKERLATTRVLGLPIWRKTVAVEDPFRGVYSQITGRDPDPEHWLVARADCHRTWWLVSYSCFRPSPLFEERRTLLATVFQRYRDGASQTQAQAELSRIDALLPASTPDAYDLDRVAIDGLRKDLGLQARFDR